jgi:hypothetical protein
MLLALGLAAGTAHAVQRITKARIRAPRKQGKDHDSLPTNPTKKRIQPWQKRTEPRPLRKEKKGWHPVGVQHDREVPTFYGDPHPRIWNAPPKFGAALPPNYQPAVRGAPRPSRTEGMFGPGGLKVWLRKHIARDRAKRYYDKLEGLRMLQEYRAQKALLGLCPVDGDERPRFVLEGKPFSQEGYCYEHCMEIYGNRVRWAEERTQHRRDIRERKRKKFIARWHTGGRFKHTPGVGIDLGGQGGTPDDARASVLQAPRPKDFPKPGDLGPNGTLPLTADPRDPAGYPFDTIDPDADKFDRVHTTEAKHWFEVSQAAP